MTITRLDVHAASEHMLANTRTLGTEAIALEASRGRVLARDVVSSVFLPPWNNSSMDGFAVHAADVRGATAANPVRLTVTETIAAGGHSSREVQRGEAVRIMTGAPVPAGADSVVRIEDTDRGDAIIGITDDRDAERNIRLRGEDVRADSVVMRAGTAIGAPHIGVLSSVGCARPEVYRRPRVAILATGDELVPLDRFDEVSSGMRIVSSNSYALAAAVTAAGGEPVQFGIAPDNPDALAERLRAAEGCDLVLTSGGVSVGDFDYTRNVVAALGGTLSLWRVRMRPGAPLGFGSLFGVPWLGLPGNPVSALVTFELFCRPLIRALGGYARPHRRTIGVTLGDAVHLGAPLTHFLRVVLDADDDDGRPIAHLTGAQSSGMLTSMSSANALIIVPPEPLDVPVGTRLRALVLDADLGGSTRFLS
ncbi:MAG: gephyrin-like molybdotransferase Glp [bacterium]